MQIKELSAKKRKKLFKGLPKKQLIKMLIANQDYLEIFVKTPDIEPLKEDNLSTVRRFTSIEKLQALANNFGKIKVVQVVENDEYCKANGVDTYLNRSLTAGADEIYLGIFSDPQLHLISFFHELGHIVCFQEKRKFATKLEMEALAWLKCFQLARIYDVTFDSYVYQWAAIQLDSYNEKVS